MRPTRLAVLAPLAVLVAAAAAPAQQTIDLSKWTIEHVNGSGIWNTDAPRLRTSFTNLVNTDCSVLFGDVPFSGVIEFNLSVDPSGGDDDVIGFVLGFNPGDSMNASSDYILVDWKKVTQNYQNWGTCKAGLALSRVTGVPARGFGNGPIDFWSHTGVCQELARGNVNGSTGWAFATNYSFRVLFTPGLIDISVNGRQEFLLPGTFKAGRFGCYNYSQSGMTFQFPLAGTFKAIGTGCQGSGGTPFLFSPEVPLVGVNFPLVLSNLPATAPVTLLLGASSTTWNGTPLPFDLGLIGAPGCKLYTSVDVTIPLTNVNGTALINVGIPTDALPGPTPFYLQGVAIDPTANGLGLVFSNAAVGTLGIR